MPALAKNVIGFFVFVGMAWAAPAGDEASLPIHRSAGSIPVMGWTCDGIKNSGEARTISLSAMDFSKDHGGKAFLGYDQQFRTWVPKGMGLVLLHKESTPGAVAAGASVAKVKFRNGQFWVSDQSHARVLQWDAPAKTWRVALDPGLEFQEFEVSFHGQIVLFGTFHSKESDNRFIECFEPFEKTPVSVEAYPSSGLSPQDEKRCGFHWDLPTTCASEEFVIGYFAMAGRLFVYDTSRHTLREITTPWKPLNSEWLRAQDHDFGVLNLNAYPGLRCLQFVPAPNRNSIGIAYQIPGRASRKNVLVAGQEKLIPVGADKESEPVKVAELDLVSMKLQPMVSDAAPRLPVWIKPNGTYGPLAEVLKAADSVPAPAKAKAAVVTKSR
jgi:hypothetical protein